MSVYAYDDTDGGIHSIPPPETPSPTLPATPERKHSTEPTFEPYTDDPHPDSHELDDGGILLQQRQIIDGPYSLSSCFPARSEA